MNITWPFPEPSTIVLSGDWHGDTNAARSAIARALRDDSPVVLQLGDFGMWPGSSGVKYLDSLSKSAVKAGIVIAWIDGNHEDFPQLYSYPVDSETNLRQIRENLYHIPRASRWQWHTKTFLALGGATSIDRNERTPMVNWWTQEAITPQDAEAAVSGGVCDIMLTHDAPAHVPVPYSKGIRWSREAIVEAWAHRELLSRVCDVTDPGRIFHGHFHQRYDAEVISNSGKTLKVSGLGANIGSVKDLHYTLNINDNF